MNKKSSLLVLGLVVVLAGAAVAFSLLGPAIQASALSYVLSSSETEVSTSTEDFSLTDEDFKHMALGCETELSDERISDLMDAFQGTSKTIYTFSNGDTSDSYKATLLPNELNYSNLEAFKADFDVCEAAGEEYPTKVSENWLLFESSCGSGFADEGEVPSCQTIRDSVSPTLDLSN